jgi:hypothetical protein
VTDPFRDRASERQGLDPVVHLRLVDKDQDRFDEALRVIAAEFRKGCDDLASEFRRDREEFRKHIEARFAEIAAKQTRNFTLVVGAILAFAGSVVTAVLVR